MSAILHISTTHKQIGTGYARLNTWHSIADYGRRKSLTSAVNLVRGASSSAGPATLSWRESTPKVDGSCGPGGTSDWPGGSEREGRWPENVAKGWVSTLGNEDIYCTYNSCFKSTLWASIVVIYCTDVQLSDRVNDSLTSYSDSG